ncbi:hypothetical protein D6C95_08317 [Aureobasidium pullulans]|nr:hypothetical protein D6C95_08317 [Aureobasidium pullulans]
MTTPQVNIGDAEWDKAGSIVEEILGHSQAFNLKGDLDILRKGAWLKLVEREKALAHPDRLSEREKEILRDEINHRWKQPASLPTAVVVLTDRSASWLSDPLNNLLGRRMTIFIGAIFGLFSPIGAAYCTTWQELILCRILLGFGMGLKEVTVPIFSAESAPERIRGALVMSWQMWTAAGIFLGCSANLAVFSAGDIAWRLQIGSAFIPAITLLLGIWLCPESPRWLMKKGKYVEAYASLLRLRNSPLQAARDLCAIQTSIADDRDRKKETKGHKLQTFRASQASRIGQSASESGAQTTNHEALSSSVSRRFIQLFTRKRNRNALIASSIIMLAQQMCGINFLAFYSSSIFRGPSCDASPTSAPLWYTWGFGLTNFLFAWPAVFAIDTFGRRALPLFSTATMFGTALIAGFCVGNTALFTVFSLLFTVCYSVGMGPIPFAYSAEVFKLSHREIGMSAAVATNNFWAAVLSLTTPFILHKLTAKWTFVMFAGLNVAAFVLIFFFVPETKQFPLERLGQVFFRDTSAHPLYQAKRVWLYIRHEPQCEAFASIDEHLLDDKLYARYLLAQFAGAMLRRPVTDDYSKWSDRRPRDGPDPLQDGHSSA